MEVSFHHHRVFLSGAILLILLLCVGCTPTAGLAWKRSTGLEVDSQAFLSKVGSSITFRASVAFRENNFSGLLVIKKEGDHQHRLAFLSDLGVTLLEFELKGEAFVLHKCPEALRRKAFLKLLETDFRIFLENPNPRLKRQFIHATQSRVCMVKKVNGRRAYYFYESESQRLKAIRRQGLGPENTFWRLEWSCDEEIPENIYLAHPFLKLSLRLSTLEIRNN